MKRKVKRIAPVLVGSRLLFQVWCEAAEEYRRLRSDPAEARCRVARANWYRAVYGDVPPLPLRIEGAA